jgi:hypothetical protein
MEWRQARRIESAAASPGKERLGHRPGRPALILYLDTSSLIKLYIEEIGSSEIEGLVGICRKHLSGQPSCRPLRKKTQRSSLLPKQIQMHSR